MAYSSSASDRLAAVRAAIERTLTSQEYNTAGGQKQRMADLRVLREMEKDLQSEAATEAAGGGFLTVGGYSRR